MFLFSNFFAEALRKHCGSIAEGPRKLKSHFAGKPPLPNENFLSGLSGVRLYYRRGRGSYLFSLDSIKCFRKILRLLLNSIVFLIIFADFYPISEISDIKNFMCCGSLRKFCGSFPRKRKPETSNNLMCCGRLRKVAEGFSRKQKF